MADQTISAMTRPPDEVFGPWASRPDVVAMLRSGLRDFGFCALVVDGCSPLPSTVALLRAQWFTAGDRRVSFVRTAVAAALLPDVAAAVSRVRSGHRPVVCVRRRAVAEFVTTP